MFSAIIEEVPITEKEARMDIERCLVEERRMGEYPDMMHLFQWYQTQEGEGFTVRYALTTTLRYIQKTPRRRKKQRYETI